MNRASRLACSMPARGFTLIEVLIALAIVAIGLGAAVRASTQLVAGAEALRLRTLAGWVAEDRLSLHLASRSWPTPGSSEGRAVQAGLGFVWRDRVSATEDASLRRLEVTVWAPGEAAPLARLDGLLLAPRAQVPR